MNDKSKVSLQAAPRKRFYREDIIAILLIAGVVIALLTVFFNYCLHLPQSKVTRGEAVILFERYFQETEEVLRSYGITGELKNPDFTEEESTLWYEAEKCVELDDGTTLCVEFSWDRYEHLFICVKLLSPRCPSREDSWLSPEDYPCVYALLNHFCAPKYQDEDLPRYTVYMVNGLKEQVAAGEEQAHDIRHLRTALFEYGFISCSNNADQSDFQTQYQSNIIISSYLY